MCLGIDASHGDAERVQALPGRDNVLRDGNVKVDVRNIRQTYPLKHKYGYPYCGSKVDTSEYNFY